VTIATGQTSQLGQGAYRQAFVHDRWASLSHVIGTGVGPAFRAPGVGTWVLPDDQRRMLAYQVLQAYVDNVRRHWLPAYMWRPGIPTDGDTTVPTFPPAMQYREYGQASALVDAARSLVLGDEQRFRVPDAEPKKNPSGELVTPPPGSLAVALQDLLDEWAEKEHLEEKLVENETRAITLGDSVLVLHWDPDVKRARLGGYDPGFYFPDWQAGLSAEYIRQGWKDLDFPPVVHLAWEWTDDNQNVWIRRTTWRMRRLPNPRRLPYKADPSPWTCEYEQADYDMGRIGDSDVFSFPRGAVRKQVVPATDLGVDFMPVVYLPNTPPGSELWGKSTLAVVAQILDDIASGDTDLAINSEVVASPKLVTKNAQAEPQPGVGAWMNFFADGDAKLLDTSHTLDALMKQAERLRQLLAQHSRLGQVLLGMVAPNDVPSGYSMRLGFASAESLEREMTMVRRRKYALLGKMVGSFASANGLIPPGPLPKIVMVLGKGLPADRAATIQEVTDLLAAHAISTSTAVQMLMEAGVPIEDAAVEVARIQAERIDIAIGIVESTGNVEAAAKYLGVEYVKPPAEPAPVGGDGTPGTGQGDTSGSPGSTAPANHPPTGQGTGLTRPTQGDSGPGPARTPTPSGGGSGNAGQ
jgi:hypothetical protein